MDPSFDWKPPKSYVCYLCKKKGQHHVSVCPLNLDPGSITQQRLRQKAKPDVLGEARRNNRQVRYHGDRWAPPRSRSPSPDRKVRRRRGNDTLRSLERFSQAELSPARHSRKRPPSRSPSPRRINSRRMGDLATKEVGASTSKKIPRSELIWRRKDPEEGRLSYEDEEMGEVTQSPSVKSAPGSPVSDGRDVVPLNISHKERVEDEDHNEYQRLWESAVLQMIREESVKTDLLHMNRIEDPPFAHLFGGSPFLNKENVVVNSTVNNTRPSSADFYGTMNDQEQQAERCSCETGAEKGPKVSTETGVFPEQVDNPSAIEPEQTQQPPAGERDVIADDREPGISIMDRFNAAIGTWLPRWV